MKFTGETNEIHRGGGGAKKSIRGTNEIIGGEGGNEIHRGDR